MMLNHPSDSTKYQQAVAQGCALSETEYTETEALIRQEYARWDAEVKTANERGAGFKELWDLDTKFLKILAPLEIQAGY